MCSLIAHKEILFVCYISVFYLKMQIDIMFFRTLIIYCILIHPFYSIVECKKIQQEPKQNNSGVSYLKQYYQELLIQVGKFYKPFNQTTFTSPVNCSRSRINQMHVELVNPLRLSYLLISNPDVINRQTEAACVVVLFYSTTCPFSCIAAPHFNALPRAFRSIKMAAINAKEYQSYVSKYGIIGVPSVILYHNGRAVAKFNENSYTLEMFAKFITKFTGLHPSRKMYVASQDFGGPVPTILKQETDYALFLAWGVILLALAVGIYQKKLWQIPVLLIQNIQEVDHGNHEHGE